MKYVNNEILTQYSKLESYRPIMRVITEYAIIIATIYITEQHFFWWSYILAIFIIGTRQHALAVLIHEGAHFRLHRNKDISEAVGEFICNTFMISLATYRNYHFAHHNNSKLNTQEDPDFARRDPAQWKYPKTRFQLFLIFMKDLFGMSTFALLREIKFNKAFKSKRSKRFEITQLCFWVVSVTALIYSNLIQYYLIYYVVAVFTVTKAILRMRALADHYGLDHRHHSTQMRDTHCSLIGKTIFFPCGSGYHGLHHVYPQVPYYQLEKLFYHAVKSPDYNHEVHVTRGIPGLIKELTS